MAPRAAPVSFEVCAWFDRVVSLAVRSRPPLIRACRAACGHVAPPRVLLSESAGHERAATVRARPGLAGRVAAFHFGGPAKRRSPQGGGCLMSAGLLAIDELVAALADTRPPALLDVRDLVDSEGGHLPGATLVPRRRLEFRI